MTLMSSPSPAEREPGSERAKEEAMQESKVAFEVENHSNNFCSLLKHHFWKGSEKKPGKVSPLPRGLAKDQTFFVFFFGTVPLSNHDLEYYQ